MIVAGLLVVPCLWGISRIRADLNFIEYFRKSSPVRQANEIIGEKIGGTQNFDVIVDIGKKGGALTFDLFQRIKGLQTYLAATPGVEGLQEQKRSVGRLNAREADRCTCSCLVEEGLGHFDVARHSNMRVGLPRFAE
jgi:predicted RND superfamily exporter protein